MIRNYNVLGRFFSLVFMLVFAVAGALAQTDTDPPQDPDEVPEVISRDEVSTEKPKNTENVRENSTQRNSGNLPTDLELTLPRSIASPYKIDLSEAQQKMMLYLDLLTRTETRAETLRTKLFEMIEKENTVMSRIGEIEFSLRPEQIQNATALSGSLRPEDVRTERKRLLESDKRNLEALLGQIQSSRRNLENAIVGADRLVERVRAKFEAFVDSALEEGNEF